VRRRLAGEPVAYLTGRQEFWSLPLAVDARVLVPRRDTETLVGMVWALCVGIVTLWLDGPLEGRCVSLGTTPERLTADIARQLEFLLTAGGSGAAKRRTNRR